MSLDDPSRYEVLVGVPLDFDRLGAGVNEPGPVPSVSWLVSKLLVLLISIEVCRVDLMPKSASPVGAVRPRPMRTMTMENTRP